MTSAVDGKLPWPYLVFTQPLI